MLSGCNASHKNNTTSRVGMLVNTDSLILYSDKNYSHMKSTYSSPALVIDQSHDGYSLLEANGDIAWTRNIQNFKQAFIKTKHLPLDGTNYSREFSEKADFRWISIKQAQKGRLERTSEERYQYTPHYVKQEGRMLGLYDWQHPYIWPEMLVAFEKIRLWTDFSDIEIYSPIKEKAHGIIISQFIPVVKYAPSIKPSKKTVTLSKNLSNLKYSPVQLHNINWTLESIILPEEKTKSDLKLIQFYSSNENSYLFSLQWKNGVTQYIGYSGIQEDGQLERIATPVLLNFYLTDKDQNGKMDWHLQVAHIRPDEVKIERLDIDGVYHNNAPSVKTVVLGWN